jgi:protein kinase-like protein
MTTLQILWTVFGQWVSFPFLSLIDLSSLQGTPPFMAIEILLERGTTFRHHIRHDLESVLYVIIWICSHMEGPEIERLDAANLIIRRWSNMESDLRTLGHTKLAHIQDAPRTILPEFTTYWDDFKPFVLNLIRAFFPANASEPNSIDPDKMVMILENAEKHVKEPPSSGASVETTDVETEMHGYNVLKYGKNYRQGQEEAPRKRVKTKPSPHTQPSIRTRSSRTGGPSRSSVSKPSKLRNTASESQARGQVLGASI